MVQPLGFWVMQTTSFLFEQPATFITEKKKKEKNSASSRLNAGPTSNLGNVGDFGEQMAVMVN